MSRVPIYSRKRRLSIVRICSSRMTESLSSPSTSFTSVCVGNFAFVCVLPVMAAIMTVGLWLFPISLEMISTGRMPSCSEPTTGLCSPPASQSAHRSAPRRSTASACAAVLLEVRKPPYVAARIRCSLKQYPQSFLPYKKLCHSA